MRVGAKDPSSLTKVDEVVPCDEEIVEGHVDAVVGAEDYG